MAKSHVAVLAFPFGGHGQALLTITNRLATISPSTIFSFFNTTQSNSSLFSSSSDDHPPNIRVYNVADGVPEGYVLSGNPLEAVEMFLEAAPEIFRKEIGVAENESGVKVTCMFTDAFIWFAGDLATEMNISSWVAFWTSGANSLTAHIYTDLIRETIRIEEVEDHMEETLGFIKGLEKIRVKDIPEGVVSGDLNSVFYKMIYQMGLALPRATAVCMNSFEELDPTLTDNLSSKFNRYLSIGPLALLCSSSSSSTSEKEKKLVEDPYGCLDWIEKRSRDSVVGTDAQLEIRPRPVVYIAFGRVMTPPPGELVAIAQGLESSKLPFIWSLKEKNMVDLPKGFLDRTKEQGMVIPWAPQVELLNHEAIGVFVSHAGWNSVLESVAAGVPMICRPIFGDHTVNARSVEAVWEIGVTISNGVFTKEGFEECLDRVLVNDDGKKMKFNAMKLKERAQEAVSIHGSSFENFNVLVDEVVKV